MKYKIGIIGYFATGKSKAGGQEAKTCALDKALKERYGEHQVLNVDTTDWRSDPFKLLFGLVKMARSCDNIIMLPAQNSVRIFLPVFQLLQKFYKNKLLYSVVGGWLPIFLKQHKWLSARAKRLDHIFVETKTMQEQLAQDGFKNVTIVPNFKHITPIKKDDISYISNQPYSLCTFSRVMKKKGIEDAIAVVTHINQSFNEVIFTLDIYGKIDDDYVGNFQKMCAEFPNYISYKGMVEPNESVNVLKNYFAVLFPTRYYTEGVPGSIIDAYMAGAPVIAARWGNHQDVFIHNVTGWGYSFEDCSDFNKVLLRLKDEPSCFTKMKSNCLIEAEHYRPENVINKICKCLME